MLQHIVLFKTKPGLGKDKLDRILTDAREKLAAIPGVSNLRAGVPVDANNPWDICLSMDFEDQAALEAYRVDPVHLAYIKENLEENRVERKALDYWMK